MDKHKYWYEMGLLMELPKETLDDIELDKGHPGSRLTMIKMNDALIEHFSFKCTLRKVVDALLEMNFNTAAEAED